MPVASSPHIRIGAGPLPRARTRARALGLLGAVLAIATPAAAQPSQPSASPTRADDGRAASLTARYHVRQMENVLERAVQHAADMMRRRLQAVTPDVLALAGAPRAQGYRIDGYGLFFSVEVPRLSESVNWALRVLSQDSDERVLASLQKVAASEQDPALRADLERAMRTIQMRLVTTSPARVVPSQGASQVAAAAQGRAARAETAASPAPDAQAAGTLSAAAPPPLTPAATMSAGPAVAPPEETSGPTPIGDPSVAYEDEVKQALVDAMLDYAGSLPLSNVEWVTVAARDAGYVAFPDAVSDMVTVTLSVRVSDLVDFRAQRLTREEARTRVHIREF